MHFPIVCSMWSRTAMWVRFFGWGFSVMDGKHWPPLFSERYGYRTVLRIGRLRIEGLKP